MYLNEIFASDLRLLLLEDHQQMITLKMADHGRSDFYVVFMMSLCALGLKQLLISLLFQSYGFDIRCACFQKLFEANL